MRRTNDVQTMHIPPDAVHVASIRAFLGAVGRHLGCSDETIEDLRLAVTEACGQALEQGAAPDGVYLRASVEGGRLAVEIEPAGTFERGELDGAEGVSRRELIRALFPDAGLEEREGRGVLRLTAPIG